ncbi:MAG: GNAT family N-acetyltransferase, partial [Bacteroidetes bacterium]
MKDIRIRRAEAADLAAIHALVGELAAYEKAADQFTATLADYERDFAAGIFESSIAEHQGEIVGMTIYYMSYSTWKGRMLYLEDFVVKQAWRQQGIGQLLFDAYLQRARELECRLAKWQVLDWNKPAIDFYRKNGALIEQQWWNGKLFLDTSHI